jgi:hypothetical protein
MQLELKKISNGQKFKTLTPEEQEDYLIREKSCALAVMSSFGTPYSVLTCSFQHVKSRY